MQDILTRKIVLVLNRNWQAIATTSPELVFGDIYNGTATALDIQGEDVMVPTPWPDWVRLPVREDDFYVGTPSGRIRVPTVVVLARYDKVPMKRPRFGKRGIWERDQGRCQYTGKKLAPGEGNIDHILPRSRGGETTWENCVLADRRVNARKGSRTPSEAGLTLHRKPQQPRLVPSTVLLENHEGIEDWVPFLLKN